MTFLFTTLLLLAVPASAQTVGGGFDQIHQWDGGSIGDNFGTSVSGVGDVNGDGFADVIVGARWASPGGLSSAGSAYVYSGADGSLLYQWDGGASGDWFGSSVSGAGDVNGDGFADVIVGARWASPGGLPSVGSAYVYSGANGTLLHQWDGGAFWDLFGYSVSGAGDINGDGFADVIVGAPFADPGGLGNEGSAYVYSGANGTLLHQWDGLSRYDELGFSVSGAGDVNGDGFADVIVGSPFVNPGNLLYAGSAYVYSGADGSLLHQWDGLLYDELGYSVSDAGDLNGDGYADVIVGAPHARPGNLLDAGSVYVYSGADGSLLHQWDGGLAGDGIGYAVSGAGDVNRDGFADVIVGAPQANREYLPNVGSAYVYSGANGTLLHQWDGLSSYDELGFSIAGAGDVNGDGFADVIVGVLGADPGGLLNAGSAYVYSFLPYLVASSPTISAAVGGVLDLTLDFPDTAASDDYITLMSIHGTGPIFYGVDIPLSLDSYVIDSANGIYPFSITSNLYGTLDTFGNGAASITIPAGAFNFAVGHTFWLAMVAFPTGQLPAYSSVAVAVKFVP